MMFITHHSDRCDTVRSMNVGEFLESAVRQLGAAGVGTSRLDVLVLLEDCLNRDRTLLLAHPELELSSAQSETLSRQLERRVRHEPLAYIRGKTEFYGREFYVDNRVLEPRPESETMIGLLKNLDIADGSLIIDVGTGSGALAITAACELNHKAVMAIDIDPHCLEVARRNAGLHGVAADFVEGDLLQPVAETPSALSIGALLCNLPYVPDNFEINSAAGHEPAIALFGGPDGLDPYRRLFGQIVGMPAAQRPRYVLTEAMPPQHDALAKIANEHDFSQAQREDFIQIFTSANR